MTQLHHRVCHLCEAMCGITIEHERNQILSIRGDADDPFSAGHICPKAAALVDIHEDPDRLRRPLRRRGADWEEVEWDTAFGEVADRLQEVRRRYGPDAVASYLGNPTVHNYGSMLYGLPFLLGLGTRNRFSATSTDQLPRMLVSLLCYGHQALFPVPDLDRTDFFLVLGANPVVSGGSIMTAPGVKKRLERLRARGGRLVVVDPRRTETAEVADTHLFIRPGTDALLLLGLLEAVFGEAGSRLGRLAPFVRGLPEVEALARRFPAERVAQPTGIEAPTIRALARDFAAAPTAAAYGRVGVSMQEFGALATWLIDALNVTTGNLDRPGGVMFPKPAFDLVGLAALGKQTGSFDSYRSRVRGLPEFGGELPVAALAEEIETPGSGQVRALLTVAGNPVLSAPNGRRLEDALGKLDFMVSVDFYLNETTRHADFILPPTFALEHDHYDVGLHAVAIRNTAKYSEPLFPKPADSRHDWEIFLELGSRLLGGADRWWTRGLALPAKFLGQRLGPDGLLDLGLRLGPYGDGFVPGKKGLSLQQLRDQPHGIDLGPLVPRLPDVLYTKDKRIHLAPRPLITDVSRLEALLAAPASARGDGSLLLIGRRDLRSNNSWMHNSRRLVKGRDRCTLLMHPDDAERRVLEPGSRVRVTSRVGAVEVTLAISDEVMPGVVSLPHGWGHHRPGTRLSVAAAHPGVSINDLTDESFVDALAGTASFSGVRVEVGAASRTEVS